MRALDELEAGYTQDFPLERMMCDAHAKTFSGGTTACGISCDSWTKFWHLPYLETTNLETCLDCDLVITQGRRQDVPTPLSVVATSVLRGSAPVALIARCSLLRVPLPLGIDGSGQQLAGLLALREAARKESKCCPPRAMIMTSTPSTESGSPTSAWVVL